MQAFDFQPRTRVVYGPGAVDRLGEVVESLGGRRVLIVSDPGVVDAGHPARAAASIEARGLDCHLFDKFAENPTTLHVNEGLAYAKALRTDLIVGLGGGSSIDCAKGVNFLLTNGGEMADYWGVNQAKKPMLPLVAVPTTAGTGSEAQSFALISDAESHHKMACGDPKAAPAAALLDPELTLTQPREVTALTGIDAIAHAIETWATKRRNPISQLYSRQAWRWLEGSLPRVLEEPFDIEARGKMLLGANYAGTAIENSMLGAAHSCANPLTARYGVAHGAAVGLMLPAVIRFNAVEVGSLYSELSAGETGSHRLAERIEELVQQAGLPLRLSDHGITADTLPDLAREASLEWTARFNPRPVSAKEMLEIYQCVA